MSGDWTDDTTESNHFHKHSPLSLVAGLASMVTAVLFLLSDLTPLSLRPAVAVPLVLLALAVAGLLSGRRRLRG